MILERTTLFFAFLVGVVGLASLDVMLNKDHGQYLAALGNSASTQVTVFSANQNQNGSWIEGNQNMNSVLGIAPPTRVVIDTSETPTQSGSGTVIVINNDKPAEPVQKAVISPVATPQKKVFALSLSRLEDLGVDAPTFTDLGDVDTLFATVAARDIGQGVHLHKYYLYSDATLFSVWYDISSDQIGLSQLYDRALIQFQGVSQVDSSVKANETNSFGLKSFYVNFTDKTKTTFVVILFRDQLYAFEYPRLESRHKILKDIFTSIGKKA